MNKTKFGVNPAFYAVLAFVLAIFGSYTWLAVLTIYLIAAEQNEWAARQSLQAMMLAFIPEIVSAVLGLGSFINRFTIIDVIPRIWGWFTYSINYVVMLLVLILGIVGLLKAAGGKEANLPLVSKFADWVYGKVAPKAENNQTTQQ